MSTVTWLFIAWGVLYVLWTVVNLWFYFEAYRIRREAMWHSDRALSEMQRLLRGVRE